MIKRKCSLVRKIGLFFLTFLFVFLQNPQCFKCVLLVFSKGVRNETTYVFQSLLSCLPICAIFVALQFQFSDRFFISQRTLDVCL
jgi:hypothetical protein